MNSALRLSPYAIIQPKDHQDMVPTQTSVRFFISTLVVLLALLQKLVGDFFNFSQGNFAGNLAGILAGFLSPTK